MPKIINNRVYLNYQESTDCSLFEKELLSAYQMANEERIVIYDQSDIKFSTEPNKLYNLYLDAYRRDSNGKRIFNRRACVELLQFVKDAEYIQLGCFTSDSKLMEEAQSLHPYDRHIYNDDQIEYCYKLEAGILKQITNNLIDEDGEVKWFNICLHKKNRHSIIFSSSHFGVEFYINDLKKEEVEGFLKIVDGDNFFVRISNKDSIVDDL